MAYFGHPVLGNTVTFSLIEGDFMLLKFQKKFRRLYVLIRQFCILDLRKNIINSSYIHIK